ncbi:hypothetical protein [Sulfurimonas sp.]|uniref:hypothetical protein n=1 Tax=Sulfurimonas sp. TaxID=2022749 RepID=UPI0025F0139D|nr:hypothetical protein [Sulfurimonas sp.]MBW6487499.1 hypothetical protein [Sulfurimonas sp.]
MNSRNFLKPKNFNIKAKSLSFESVEFMTDLEKKKIYINFVKLLNNHFKRTLFKKNLYEHFHCHCGFIAHNNIHGFYGEYFETAANFHFNVNGYTNPMHECGGNLNSKSTLSHGEQFYAIYEELNGSRYSLGAFHNQICGNMNYGDYRDLDDAIKDAFSEYMEIWREEIKKAIKAWDKFNAGQKVQELREEQEKIKTQKLELESKEKVPEVALVKESVKTQSKPITQKEQPTLFDFVA